MSRRARICWAPLGPGPVARLDHPLVDEHAVRGRRPDVATGAEQDVGDEPGDRALAVRPRDRDDRDPPVRVADPRRRRGARLGDALRPAREQPFLVARQVRGPRWRDVSSRERQRRLGRSSGRAPRRATGTSRSSDPGRTSDGRPRRRAPRRGRRAGGGSSATTASMLSGQSRGGTDRAEVDQRVATRDRAGRTRSAAGRRRPRASPPAPAGRRWVPRAGGSRPVARSGQDSKRASPWRRPADRWTIHRS